MRLQNYLSGKWQDGSGEGRALVNPVTGTEIARADATGLDLEAALGFCRKTGGPALRALNFAERGALLKAIASVLKTNRETYFAIARQNSGNTEADAAIDIDGTIYTLGTYARFGASLGETGTLVEPGQDQLAGEPVFFARHFWTTRPGVAVQINAFNFPSWGMWEKIAQALLAGVPSFAKPASSTAMLSEQMVRDVLEAKILPEGALSLLCGSASGLAAMLGPMDSLAFTGSASTAQILRREIAEMELPPRLTVEADSVNATILGPEAKPGDALFDLALREAGKALSVKAGQLCTNIRRILVPAEIADGFGEALAERVGKLSVGDPADEATRVGPLVNSAQRKEAEKNKQRLLDETKTLAEAALPDVSPQSGFFAPALLRCDDPARASAVHEVEVFGPCTTLIPYRDMAEATKLAAKAAGSLALSLFSDEPNVQDEILQKLGPWHGRVMMVDSEVGKAHSGHFNVMPQCVHGGPGRAGGGEELGGLRGLRFHMQRTALQAGPTALGMLAGKSHEATL